MGLIRMSSSNYIKTETVLFKTKLSDGRYFVVSDDTNMSDTEYLIIIDSQPILSDKLPVLLRKKISNVSFFTKIEHRYVKTEINKTDHLLVKILISNTPLNKFNVLFGKCVIEE